MTYEEYAQAFVSDKGIEDAERQVELLVEEAEEAEEAITVEEDMAHAAEEIADVLVVAFGLSVMLGVDVEEAYRRKMEYNLKKSSERDESGKVTDDSDIEKPGFGDLV